MKQLKRFLLRIGFLAATVAAAVPAQAQFTGGTGTSSPGEDIGTVPAHWNPDDFGEFDGRLVLVGTPRQLGAAVQGFRGTGVFSYSLVGSATDEIRLTFYGDVRLALDEEAIRTLGVKVYFELAPKKSWAAQVGLGDWQSGLFEVDGGESLEVPVGLLRPDRPGPLRLDLASPEGGSIRLRAVLDEDGILRLRVKVGA